MTLRVERSCSSRSNSSFIRSATASRLSLRYLALLLLAPLAVRRARVSFTCFETSSSLTSGRTIGLGAALPLFLLRRPSPGLGWFWAPGRFCPPCPGRFWPPWPPCPPCLLPPPCALPLGALLTSTFSFCRRLRLCLPPATNPDTSIVPSTCGPVRVTVSGRKMLSLGAAGSGAGAGASAGLASGCPGACAVGAGVAGAAGFAGSAGAACAAGAGVAGAAWLACVAGAGCAGRASGTAGAGAGAGCAAALGAWAGAGAAGAAGCCAAGFSASAFGAGAALGLGDRSILPRNFGCWISSLTLITLLLMTTSFSSSRSCFLASSRVMVVCFREIRSRIDSRALPAARFAPNSFSRTA